MWYRLCAPQLYDESNLLRGGMKGKNIILALSAGKLRDELLLNFGHQGAKIYTVPDRTSLMSLLKRTAIDCILIQMMFENEDSIELILKILDINDKIPILLIDRSGTSHYKLAQQLKVAAYFQKPFSSIDIVRRTDEILNVKKKPMITNKTLT